MDVFLSYSHEDREAAQKLSEALRNEGFSVWWDRTILAGRNYQDEIERALHDSGCVIVLWSRYSVTSDWVKEEASFARSQGKLIPVLLDDSKIPVPFALIQTVTLRGWDGASDSEEFRRLVNGVRDRTGKPAQAEARPEARAGRRLAPRATLVSWAWIILPSVLVGCLAWALMGWRVPTQVEIDVTAPSVDLHSSERGDATLLSSMPVRSLSVLGLKSINLPVSSAAVANPKDYDVEHDSYGEGAWTGLNSGPALDLTPVGSLSAQATFRADGGDVLTIEKISAGTAEIQVTSPAKDEMRLKLLGPRIGGAIALPANLIVDTQYLKKDGSPFPFSGPTLRLRLSVLEGNNSARYSAAGSLLFDLELFRSGQAPTALASGWPLGGIEFSSVNAGSISYPECPRIAPVVLKPADLLALGDLRGFYLREVGLTEQERSVRIKAEGIAGDVRSGPKGGLEDRRLTRFDLLWNNQKLVALFTLLAWLIVTSLPLRKYLKDNSGK